jgi:hypothetical protein
VCPLRFFCTVILALLASQTLFSNSQESEVSFTLVSPRSSIQQVSLSLSLSLSLPVSLSPLVKNHLVKKSNEVIKKIPEDRLLLETDWDCVAMMEPAMLSIAKLVGAVRGWSIEETLVRTRENARRAIYSRWPPDYDPNDLSNSYFSPGAGAQEDRRR